ncbi:MAG: hypothetical protein P8017_00310, partial [Deltaproteobacteria bacterium]
MKNHLITRHQNRKQKTKTEVNAINGKNKTLALFSVITIAAIVSGILLAPQMVNATETNSTDLTTQTSTTTTNDKTTQQCFQTGTP